MIAHYHLVIKNTYMIKIGTHVYCCFSRLFVRHVLFVVLFLSFRCYCVGFLWVFFIVCVFCCFFVCLFFGVFFFFFFFFFWGGGSCSLDILLR